MPQIRPEHRQRLPVLPTLRPLTHVLILLATTIVLLISGSSVLPLIDRDEPRFAQATCEMQEAHEWFVPTFNGDYRFDKPPLTYWLMHFSYAICGWNEFGARFHSILCAIALVLVVYAVGTRWFTAATGFGAGFGLATCFQLLIHGRLSVADLPMILALTIAQWAFYELLQPAAPATSASPYRWSWFWTFYLAQAAGFLAKGPVVAAVTLLTALLFRFVFWREAQPWKQLKLTCGLPLTLGIISLWGIPGLIRTHGLWWQIGMNRHVVERGLESFDGRPHFLPFYFATAFLSLFPWIALAGYGWLALRKNWNRTNAFLCAWLAAPYLIFTGYATQLPHYVLPAFPAFFLLLAQIITLPRQLPAWPHYFYRGVMILFGLFEVALLALIGLAPWTEPYSGLRNVLLGLWGFLAGLIFLVLFYRASRFRWMPLALLLLSAGLIILSVSLRPLHPAPAIARLVRSLPAEVECYGGNFSEPSLVFYTHRHWQLDQTPAQLRSALLQPGPRLVVTVLEERTLGHAFSWLGQHWKNPDAKMKVKNYAEEISALPTDGYRTLDLDGLNLARSTWVKLRIFYRP